MRASKGDFQIIMDHIRELSTEVCRSLVRFDDLVLTVNKQAQDIKKLEDTIKIFKEFFTESTELYIISAPSAKNESKKLN